jgi:chromosome partitioning protein
MGTPRVISFINYKGGVGKTTTTYHIGCWLAQHFGKKVLLVDIDPQTNLTFLCAAPEEWEKQKKRVGTIASMYKRFLDRKPPDTKRFIWATPIKLDGGRIANLDLIPCDVDLLGEDLGGGQVAGTFPTLESLRRHAREFMRERTFLRNAIRAVEDKYDFILIDCPPNLYLMTQNALMASHWYVITAIPDHLSTIGLSILQDKVRKIAGLTKSALTITGETPERYDIARLGGVIFVKVRIGASLITNTHLDRMQRVGSLLGKTNCFATHTTELIGYSEAAENSVPVWSLQSPNAQRAAKKGEYQNITAEFLERFGT